MKYIPNSVSRTFARQILVTQKHSPRILFVAGAVGVVATTVMASRATLRLEEEVLETARKQIHGTKELRETATDFTEQDYRRDMTIIYLRATGRALKLYGPSIVLGVSSIACLTTSHKILTQRNAALTAAYAAVEQSLKQYRERVRQELGEEKDKQFMYGSQEQTIVEETKQGVKKKQIKRFADGGSTPYSRLFNEYNENWRPDPYHNITFLRGAQNHMNDRLRAHGHVFLNEVYDLLGIERSSIGQLAGWVFNKGTGDDIIDFGCWDPENFDKFHDFMMGREKAILLDFNVDGDVHQLI